MSLMSRLMAARAAAKVEAKEPAAAPTPPIAAPVTKAEWRHRIAEGHARRNAAVEPAPSLPVPTSAQPPPVMVARGSCKAISADTGRQCALLAGHESLHRHGSTDFARVASSTQTTFRKRDQLDAAALASSPLTTPGE